MGTRFCCHASYSTASGALPQTKGASGGGDCPSRAALIRWSAWTTRWPMKSTVHMAPTCTAATEFNSSVCTSFRTVDCASAVSLLSASRKT